MVNTGSIDVLHDFTEACRQELEALASLTSSRQPSGGLE